MQVVSRPGIDLGPRGRWTREVVSTPWLEPGDDLAAVVAEHVVPLRDGAAFVVVTEKVVSLAAGLGVAATDITVGRTARFLSRRVRPRGDSLALSVPEKMQWVLDEVGVPRVLAAAVVSGATRRFTRAGLFYRIAGERARSVDGVRGAYPHTLLPPLTADLGATWCERISRRVGLPVAIVDMNDRGGSVRATSPGLDADLVAAIVADNPLGAGRAGTPIAVIRPSGLPPAGAPDGAAGLR